MIRFVQYLVSGGRVIKTWRQGGKRNIFEETQLSVGVGRWKAIFFPLSPETPAGLVNF